MFIELLVSIEAIIELVFEQGNYRNSSSTLYMCRLQRSFRSILLHFRLHLPSSNVDRFCCWFCPQFSFSLHRFWYRLLLNGFNITFRGFSKLEDWLFKLHVFSHVFVFFTPIFVDFTQIMKIVYVLHCNLKFWIENKG